MMPESFFVVMNTGKKLTVAPQVAPLPTETCAMFR
jgi:hypothetical protein